MLGTGSAKRNLQGHAIYIMRVGRILSFDEYWLAEEFAEKRPTMNGSNLKRYGDNIYHRNPINGEWIQEDSFHSQVGGVLDSANLAIDTGHTEKVLIADWFLYWGTEAPKLPENLAFAVHAGIGHRTLDAASQIDAVVSWAEKQNHASIGDPVEWKFEGSKVRRAMLARTSR